MPNIEDQNTEANIEPIAQEPAKPEVLPESEPDTPVEPEPGENGIKRSHWQRFGSWYKTKKKLSIPLTVLVLLLILGAVPWTRNSIAGLFISHDVTVQVVDSKTGAAVSEAKVVASSGGTGTTSGTGYVSLHKIKPGKLIIKVTKKYYKDGELKVTAGLLKPSKALNIQMQATGRQIKISIANVITKKGLANVDIKISDVDVKTDASGNATAVLPAGTLTKKATLKLSGYNNTDVTVKVSDTDVKENKFNLTPAGHIYFLSNRTGRIDVMKANLDGSDPAIVLAGTGNEDANNTVLIASPDWKYLALLAKRDPNASKVYIITTSDDQLSTADEGSASFTLSGWLADNLIYTVTRSDLSAWKTGAGKLKSYDATTGKLALLDQTTGTGDATSNSYEYYGLVYLTADSVVYAKGWTTQGTGTPDFSGKQETLSSISANGQDHKVIASYDAATKSVYYTPHGLNSVYIVQNTQGQSDYTYYDYVIGSTPKQITLSNDQLYKLYPTYYLSPDTKQTLWTEDRDGNVILVGDDSGSSGKILVTTGKVLPFGWFTPQYILISKDSSELDIMSSSGGTPLKITNYLNTSNYGVAPVGGHQ